MGRFPTSVPFYFLFGLHRSSKKLSASREARLANLIGILYRGAGLILLRTTNQKRLSLRPNELKVDSADDRHLYEVVDLPWNAQRGNGYLRKALFNIVGQSIFVFAA